MVFKESVEISDGFLEIATFVEDIFGYFYQWAFFIRYDGGSSRYIINQRDFSKRIARVIIDIFLFFPLFGIFAFHAVHSLEHDIEILSFVSLLEDDLMEIVVLKFKVSDHLLKGRCFGVERLFNEDDFLHGVVCTLRMLMRSSRS